jgi:hypothetical protein
MTKIIISENGNSQVQNVLSDTINKLNKTINIKEDAIINLEADIKKL